MIFFQPTDEFLDWLIVYANGRIIADLGCGEGYLLHLLNKRGVKAIGVEPFGSICPENGKQYSEFNFETPNNILPLPAQECGLIHEEEKCLLIAARPDHSGWITDIAETAKAELLYIGLPKNIKTDLEDIAYEIIKTPKLKEEIVLKIKNC